jgi:hypothetical protein
LLEGNGAWSHDSHRSCVSAAASSGAVDSGEDIVTRMNTCLCEQMDTNDFKVLSKRAFAPEAEHLARGGQHLARGDPCPESRLLTRPPCDEICWSLRNDRPLGAEVVTDPRGKFELGRHGRRSRESAAEDQSGLNTGARTKPPWQDIVADFRSAKRRRPPVSLSSHELLFHP